MKDREKKEKKKKEKKSDLNPDDALGKQDLKVLLSSARISKLEFYTLFLSG